MNPCTNSGSGKQASLRLGIRNRGVRGRNGREETYPWTSESMQLHVRKTRKCCNHRTSPEPDSNFRPKGVHTPIDIMAEWPIPQTDRLTATSAQSSWTATAF